MLAATAAAGGIAADGFGGRFGVISSAPAQAQAARRIDQFDPALDQIISTSEPIVDLATNLGGTTNVEGLLWWKEGDYLLFRGTDYRRWKYAPGQPPSVFKENTNAANGITRDMQGRLVACESATRRIVREERDGNITVMASGSQGRPFNRPNDIVVKSDGAVRGTAGGRGAAVRNPRHGAASARRGIADDPRRGWLGRRLQPDRGLQDAHFNEAAHPLVTCGQSILPLEFEEMAAQVGGPCRRRVALDPPQSQCAAPGCERGT
jgi:hypothetical protein